MAKQEDFCEQIFQFLKTMFIYFNKKLIFINLKTATDWVTFIYCSISNDVQLKYFTPEIDLVKKLFGIEITLTGRNNTNTEASQVYFLGCLEIYFVGCRPTTLLKSSIIYSKQSQQNKNFGLQKP